MITLRSYNVFLTYIEDEFEIDHVEDVFVRWENTTGYITYRLNTLSVVVDIMFANATVQQYFVQYFERQIGSLDENETEFREFLTAWLELFNLNVNELFKFHRQGPLALIRQVHCVRVIP